MVRRLRWSLANRRPFGGAVSPAPLFTDHERRVLASDDRRVDRVFARRAVVWRIPRRPVSAKTCPHGVAVTSDCRACPAWGAA